MACSIMDASLHAKINCSLVVIEVHSYLKLSSVHCDHPSSVMVWW